MNYGQNRVTMIDELPDLEDMERGGNYQIGVERQVMNRPELSDERYQKHIRPSYRMNPQSGMEFSNNYPNQYRDLAPPQPTPPTPPTPPPEPFPPNYPYFNCLDISRHIQDCPICTKFYHNDKTVYILVIVILSIVCLLLLKKVLNL
jgi:hypothetical protein